MAAAHRGGNGRRLADPEIELNGRLKMDAGDKGVALRLVKEARNKSSPGALPVKSG